MHTRPTPHRHRISSHRRGAARVRHPCRGMQIKVQQHCMHMVLDIVLQHMVLRHLMCAQPCRSQRQAWARRHRSRWTETSIVCRHRLLMPSMTLLPIHVRRGFGMRKMWMAGAG